MDIQIKISLFVCHAPDCRDSKMPGMELVPLYDLETRKGARGRKDPHKMWNDEQIQLLTQTKCKRCGTRGIFENKESHTLSQRLSLSLENLKTRLNKLSKSDKKIQQYLAAIVRLDPIDFGNIKEIEALRRFYFEKHRRDISRQLYVWYVRSFIYHTAKRIVSWRSIAEGTWDEKSAKWEADINDIKRNLPRPVPVYSEQKGHTRELRPLFFEGRFCIQLWSQGGQKKLLLHPIGNRSDLFKEFKRVNLKIIHNAPFQNTWDVYTKYINKITDNAEIGWKLGTGDIKHFCEGLGMEKSAKVLVFKELYLLLDREKAEDASKNARKEAENEGRNFFLNNHSLRLYPRNFKTDSESTSIALATAISIQQLLNILKHPPAGKGRNSSPVGPDRNRSPADTVKGDQMDEAETFIKNLFETEKNRYEQDSLTPPPQLAELVKVIATGTPMSQLPDSDQKEIKAFAQKSPRFAMALRKAQFACQEQIRYNVWSKVVDDLKQEAGPENRFENMMRSAFGKGKRSLVQIAEEISAFTHQLMADTRPGLEPAFKSTGHFSWKPDQPYRINVSMLPEPQMNFMHVLLYRKDQKDVVLLQANEPIAIRDKEFNMGIPFDREDEGVNVIFMAYSPDEVTLDESWFEDHVLTEPDENMARVIDRIREQGGYIFKLGSVSVTV